MSVYKYVRPSAVIRYLQGWALRVTPPDQFNDPFELKPTFSLDAAALRESAPEAAVETLAREFKAWATREVPTLGPDTDATANKLATLILGRMTIAEEVAFLETVPSNETREALLAFKTTTIDAFRNILSDAEAALPTYSLLAQGELHKSLAEHFGVVCLSRSPKNLLMWGHYTEDHQGAVLEFDDACSCFSRPLGTAGELGQLHQVRYSDVRPGVSGAELDTFASLALTKALPWAYEQEVRMIWPLHLADRTVRSDASAPVHLINVPPPALRGIVFGCRATQQVVDQAKSLLVEAGANRHVLLRRAVLDEHVFDIKYVNGA